MGIITAGQRSIDLHYLFLRAHLPHINTLADLHLWMLRLTVLQLPSNADVLAQAYFYTLCPMINTSKTQVGSSNASPKKFILLTGQRAIVSEFLNNPRSVFRHHMRSKTDAQCRTAGSTRDPSGTQAGDPARSSTEGGVKVHWAVPGEADDGPSGAMGDPVPEGLCSAGLPSTESTTSIGSALSDEVTPRPERGGY